MLSRSNILKALGSIAVAVTIEMSEPPDHVLAEQRRGEPERDHGGGQECGSEHGVPLRTAVTLRDVARIMPAQCCPSV